MKITEKVLAADSNRVTEDGVHNLFERMERMVAQNPSFCNITWGAGGTTADLKLEIANKMQNIVKHIRAKYGDYFGIQSDFMDADVLAEAHLDVVESDGLSTLESYQNDLA
ncbi:hypothetical protein CR513_05548, partial [Mucuna pruriens]